VELGSTAVAPSGRVRLKFHSPVALTKDEKTGGTVTPELLTARLLDRFELLVRAYQREPVEWDHGRFRELAAAVRVVKSDLSSTAVARQSRRASRMIPLRGVAGTLEVDSVEPRLFALWRLGEAIQVGKQTAFGFGVMRAEWC
jgi:CRISPR/Cas system endoribonuclease Cas6 (RAMP superfamily)